jgi:zinc transport system ATP-binding protein
MLEIDQTTPIVEARDLGVEIAGRHVLDHVDFSLFAGETVGVVGLNGCGKSTLAKVLLGLMAPSSGSVARRAGVRVGYVPQHIDRDPTLPLTVQRFLELGQNHKLTTDEIEESFGISSLLNSQLSALSGGEARRALLARAILRRPQLLVLDEPMSGVDAAGQAVLYDMIKRAQQAVGFGAMIIGHEIAQLAAHVDRLICLDATILCEGQPARVMADPRFQQLFGPLPYDGVSKSSELDATQEWSAASG